MTNPLTPERLREVLSYDPLSGDFTWLRGSRSTVSQPAGTFKSDGYRVIIIDNQKYRAHRLAWLYVHGTWPAQQIDHINGDRADNRWRNLRDVSHAENQHNRLKPPKSVSGLMGAIYEKRRACWRSTIRVDGTTVYLGTFPSAEEAHAAYCTAKATLHPTWAGAT